MCFIENRLTSIFLVIHKKACKTDTMFRVIKEQSHSRFSSKDLNIIYRNIPLYLNLTHHPFQIGSRLLGQA